MSYNRNLNLRDVNPILVILGINVLVFIAVNISSGLLSNLALWSGPVFVERPWGLITSMFTHYDFFHLLANMITLYFFGSFLMRIIGARNFWLVYLAGGLMGGIFFIALASVLRDAITPAVGASGAIFALGGALTILVPYVKVYIFPIPAPLPLWVAVIGGFVILSFLPGVAWEAHLGGLLTGLAAGLLYRRGRRYYF